MNNRECIKQEILLYYDLLFLFVFFESVYSLLSVCVLVLRFRLGQTLSSLHTYNCNARNCK